MKEESFPGSNSESYTDPFSDEVRPGSFSTSSEANATSGSQSVMTKKTKPAWSGFNLGKDAQGLHWLGLHDQDCRCAGTVRLFYTLGLAYLNIEKVFDCTF